MPERTGAHCLYDRFAAAVRRQITIAIPGSLRKKPRRRQRLSPRPIAAALAGTVAAAELADN